MWGNWSKHWVLQVDKYSSLKILINIIGIALKLDFSFDIILLWQNKVFSVSLSELIYKTI